MIIPRIALIGAVHILCGFSIAVSHGVALITPLALLRSIAGDDAVPLILFFVGILAIASYFVPDEARLVFIVPQQAVLTIQASSLIFTVATGHYPDGYVPNLPWPRLFILNDQIWSVFACVSHSLEVISIARAK